MQAPQLAAALGLILLFSAIPASAQLNSEYCDSCAKVSDWVADTIGTVSDTPTDTDAAIEAVSDDYSDENSTATDVATLVRQNTPLDASVESVLNLTDITAGSSVLYWNANLSEFANAPDAPIQPASGSTEDGQVVIQGKTISTKYKQLANRQGINDQRYFSARHITSNYATERVARYKALVSQIRPSVRRYNVFWHVIEASSQLAFTDPTIKCPAGFIKYPSTPQLLTKFGFKAYHCYNYAQLADIDSYLANDAANGIESAAIMWGSPAAYRTPGCKGSTTPGKIACAPSAASLTHWADFANLLTSRWNGAKGRFTHYIIWNEVASPQWFDMSPEVNDVERHIENTPDATILATRYTKMMSAVHGAIKQNLYGKPSLIYVSIDRMWTASPWCPGPKWGSRCPLGAINLLNEIWKLVGTRFDWSVAVHPYGVPTKSDWGLKEPYQAFTFADLGYVRDYQIGQLKAHGVANPYIAPQAMLAATEQGWSTGTTALDVTAAQYICVAHNIAQTPGSNILWVAHNDFQDVYAVYPGSYGIARNTDGDNLETKKPSAGLLAYRATHPSNWLKNRGHYCCKTFQLGCTP